ncbi:Cytochrome b5 heme-binding domain-containing protein [Aphelenchoides bicaudatus]|nr:Cytochrome b5 heme-binding domain-containing protein [Aphelenchoides bicaudatus]
MSDNQSLQVYSLEEVSKHKTSASLWIIIEGLIYDVTKFIEEHPGGEDVIMNFVGEDATEGFVDVGHSSDAKEMTKQYLIGRVQT